MLLIAFTWAQGQEPRITGHGVLAVQVCMQSLHTDWQSSVTQTSLYHICERLSLPHGFELSAEICKPGTKCMHVRQPILVALASLAPCSHAPLLTANACWRTSAGVAAVQTGCALKLASAQRAQQHRLFSQPRQQTLPHCWPRRSLGTHKTCLLSVAASPADPYLKTAKLRQLLVVLDITDIKDLQSLIRQA